MLLNPASPLPDVNQFVDGNWAVRLNAKQHLKCDVIAAAEVHAKPLDLRSADLWGHFE
jgi:hypothetical protein